MSDILTLITLDDRGVACIQGTTTKVTEVVLNKEWAGQTPEELQQDMAHLTLAQVYAALAYYHQHKEELDREIEDGERLAASLADEAGDSPFAKRIREGGWRPKRPAQKRP